MPSFLGHPRVNTITLPPPVYATWNRPGTDNNVALSKWNLMAEVIGATTGSAYGASATPGDSFDSGKRYVEVLVDRIAGASSGIAVGFSDTDQPIVGELGDMAYAYSLRGDGYKESNGTALPVGPTIVEGSIIQLAISSTQSGPAAIGRIWFGVNGTWLSSGDPASDANPLFVDVPAPLSTDWAIRATLKTTGDRLFANFGNAPFVYPVPFGFGKGWGYNII